MCYEFTNSLLYLSSNRIYLSVQFLQEIRQTNLRYDNRLPLPPGVTSLDPSTVVVDKSRIFEDGEAVLGGRDVGDDVEGALDGRVVVVGGTVGCSSTKSRHIFLST